MIIKSLELSNFRNYLFLSMEFDSGTNILYGDNAQGKTNILEAIFVSATTKSHKSSKDKDIVNFKEEEAHIRTYLEKEGVETRVDMHLRKNKSKGNYGGRAEIVNAVNEAIKAGQTVITEEILSENLYTAGTPDPDLVIRTGGDLRISNFLLWQSAYSEIVVLDTLWPDFDKKDVIFALSEFLKRKRRFGGLNKEDQVKK